MLLEPIPLASLTDFFSSADDKTFRWVIIVFFQQRDKKIKPNLQWENSFFAKRSHLRAKSWNLK